MLIISHSTFHCNGFLVFFLVFAISSFLLFYRKPFDEKPQKIWLFVQKDIEFPAIVCYNYFCMIKFNI